ncbi:uncharacterized protein DDB_G0284459-like, partial [Musca vetustissima]|uniref:uncharacterized protein DDB_G0284459-like n=1 Tax=Musca vetustissima TaxID=27455 RepID=UPI002AB75601
LPHSNVMSIKLHSPQAATEVNPTTTTTAVKVVPPIAKPRTVNSNVAMETKTTTTTTQPHKPYQTSLPTKDSLKIIKEARGARQLRDHELSYFGIAASQQNETEKLKSKYPALNSGNRNSPKRSLPLRRVSEEMTGTNGRRAENDRSSPGRQWQLEHDKPDLLKHNPPAPKSNSQLKPAERISLKKKAELEDAEEEHLYENIANEITPVFKVKEVYDRKLDLQRDAMILSEMNESADQTLRELSDESSLKDRKRRSLQRRNSKPLETIDEKSITEKISDTCIAVKVARGTFASEARKTSRHSTPSPNRQNIAPRERTSSQSSVECCPRARSRSLSSEKEYENIKSATKSSRSTQMVKHKSHRPHEERRSSSLDSQRSYHSQYSSGEEQQQNQQLRNSFRREDRSRAKTKRPSNTSSSTSKSQRPDLKSSSTKSSSHSEFQRSSSTTRSSTHKERAECHKENTNGLATSQQHSKRDPHTPGGSSSLQRGSAISSSGRRHRDELRDSQRLKRSSNQGTSSSSQVKSSSERHEKSETNGKHSSSRLTRDDERNNSLRSSAHRMERSGGEKSEKLSKSKAHSSRSTSQQRHEQRSTTTTTTTATTTSTSNGVDERHGGKSSKSAVKAVTTTAENTTYVSVTNLANEQKQETTKILETNNEHAREEIKQISSSSASASATHTIAGEEKQEISNDTTMANEKSPPPKPPRKKRKHSLIPIAIPAKPERVPPLPPSATSQNSQSPSLDSPTYEYKLKSKIIPPTYSNQSTLRKSSLPRPISRLALLNKSRKHSQKSTHSTSSSFAFLPYLPAKRNSDVSHVYDNYMLYAVPAAINTKAYQQNLVNDHAQLFGSAGANRYHQHQYYGGGGKGLRRRTVRSTVSTHQPFGICTCS